MRFFTSSLANHVVVESPDGATWIVPLTPDGWHRRTPYRGYRESLEPYSPDSAEPGRDDLMAAAVGAS